MDDSALEHAMNECLVDFEVRGVAAIEHACRRHPEFSEVIRERFGLVQFLEATSRSTPPVLRGRFGTSLEILGRIHSKAPDLTYRARTHGQSDVVTVKMLPIIPSRHTFERIRRDTRRLAGTRHSNILRIEAVDIAANGQLLAVMESCGETRLDDLLQESAGLAPDRLRAVNVAGDSGHSHVRAVTELGIAIAEALHHGHELDVIHRSIAPGRIAVRSDGPPMLAEYGLSVGMDLPAPALRGEHSTYLAPEQITDAVVDLRADVYGLGATLFRCLTGRPPFVGETRAESSEPVRERPADRASRFNSLVSERLAAVIQTAMHKNPAHRYSSARELRDALIRSRGT